MKKILISLLLITSGLVQGMQYADGRPIQLDPRMFGSYVDRDTYTGDLKQITEKAIRTGYVRAIGNTAEKTFDSVIAFIPSLMKRFGLMWGAFFYKLFHGSRGLSFASLQLMSTEVERVVKPYTSKMIASTDRVKRMTEINQEMNNDVRDLHWEKIQEKIKQVLDAAQTQLIVSLPCYNSTFAQQRGMRAWLAGCMQTFSSHDNEQISRLIISTRADLETLKEYIKSFKSYKEVEQNNDHIKKWLIIVLGDLAQLAALIEGEGSVQMGGGENRMQFRTMAGSQDAAQNILAALQNGG